MSTFKIRPDGLFDPEGKYPNPLTNQPYSKIYSKFAFNKDPKGWTLFTAYTDRIKSTLLGGLYSICICCK